MDELKTRDKEVFKKKQNHELLEARAAMCATTAPTPAPRPAGELIAGKVA